MHVLVTEGHFGDSDDLVEKLRAIGVQVTGCHDRVGYCRVLRPGGRCPLDDFTGNVDLVADVRGSGDELTVREYGAICAVRARRPLWIIPADPDIPVVAPPGLRNHAVVATEAELLTLCLRRHPSFTGHSHRP